MKYDSIVIGNGLFGSLITRGLRDQGKCVLLLGDDQPEAGSPPAACLVRPEWTGKIPHEVVGQGLKFLDERYKVYHREFEEITPTGKHKHPLATFFDPQDMLLQPDLRAHVHLVTQCEEGRLVQAMCKDRPGLAVEFMAPQVVVAAGFWSQRLVPWVDLELVGKTGIAFLYDFRDLENYGFSNPLNIVRTWAPYRQIVGFDRNDGYWISDGAAILERNWTSEKAQQSYLRCASALFGERATRAGNVPNHRALLGIRPYTQEKPCFCKQVSPGLWVAVGAAKNGTLLGGYCASLIMEQSK